MMSKTWHTAGDNLNEVISWTEKIPVGDWGMEGDDYSSHKPKSSQIYARISLLKVQELTPGSHQR